MILDSQQLHASFQVHQDEIASHWAEAIARICDGSETPAQLERLLAPQVGRLAEALFSNPFHPARAQGVGARLVDLGCGQSRTLAQTQRVLTRQFVARLPPDSHSQFYPRVGAVLAEVAAGFTDQMRRHLLQHQEELRDELLVARKEAEDALRAERDFVSAVLDTADVLILVTDAEGHILRFNRACEQVSGYRSAEVQGQYAGFLLSEQSLPDLQELSNSLAPDSYPSLPVRYDNMWRTRDGSLRAISWSVTALYSDDGQIANYIGTGLDVTEQQATEAELKQARRQLALAEEAERLRLAQDLHDDAVQQLLGLSYQLADMQGRAADDSRWTAAQRLEEVIPGLEVMRQEMVAVAQGLRRLIGELRPPGLRDIGLREALEGYLNGPEWARGEEAPAVRLDLPGQFDCELPESTRNCLLRVAQEALWNARKHAAARRIVVSAACGEEEIWLRVKDDGSGFDVPTHLHRFAVHQRFGLLGMQERVAAEGGELRVRSFIGEGTEVYVHVPLRQRGSNESTNHGAAGRRSSADP